jgi:Zn finger protein HypA/HybF involved in hydrogenase expression
MKGIVIVVPKQEPYEYFCKDCLQLRLAFELRHTCGNCGSTNIIKGAIGTLDKESLKRGKP